jgi:serine/threonine protein kinase
MIFLNGICEAMRYLPGDLEIVHRDLKPANVMLSNDDKPVVGDFGLAKLAGNASLRQTFQAGSPIYMAPELVRDEEYTRSVDVYAFAIMAWEIITGGFAFADVTSPVDVKRRVVNGERPKFQKGFPENWKQLIERAWSGTGSDRPSFAEICQMFKDDSLRLSKANKRAFEAYVKEIARQVNGS